MNINRPKSKIQNSKKNDTIEQSITYSPSDSNAVLRERIISPLYDIHQCNLISTEINRAWPERSKEEIFSSVNSFSSDSKYTLEKVSAHPNMFKYHINSLKSLKYEKYLAIADLILLMVLPFALTINIKTRSTVLTYIATAIYILCMISAIRKISKYFSMHKDIVEIVKIIDIRTLGVYYHLLNREISIGNIEPGVRTASSVISNREGQNESDT